MATKVTPPTTVNDESLFADSYAKVEPEIQAMDAGEIAQISLDIPSAVATVLGALPEILELRAATKKALPTFDIRIFDNLEMYALALSHAHTRSLASLTPSDDLPTLNEEGTETRNRLLADANALAKRGLIPAEALKNCNGFTGYKHVASDVQLLVAVLREGWPRIKGKCAIELEELDRADKLAARMLRLAGLREQAPSTTARWNDNRGRAYTLFVRCYDQIRRAVTYLRWDEDDIDSIAPSLWAGRIRKGKTHAGKQAEPPVPAPAAAEPSPGTPANPAGGNSGQPFM